MGDCENCVLTHYCTRKNINRIDGYCRLDGLEGREYRRRVCNSLWLVGDEKWKEYDD